MKYSIDLPLNSAPLRDCCALMLATMLVSGCDWVDSTGVQSPGTGDVLVFNNELANQSDTDVRTQALLESAKHTVVPTISDSASNDIAGWNWGSPYQSGALPECENFNGFDPQFTRTTLALACAESNQCELGFNQREQDNHIVFDVLVPELKASIGLSYQLRAFDNSGQNTDNLITLCLISINEAPIARNDQFSVENNTTLVVSATDPVHLLSNDEDDEDIRNQPLRVNPVPVREPDYALDFVLRTDGGFTYVPAPGTDAESDSFIYEVSDGQHTTSATVVLQRVSGNKPPKLVARIPTIEVVAGQPLLAQDARFNLSAYFRDPEGNALQFSVLENSLPSSGNIRLSADGRLSGTPEVTDIGDYRVTVVASDGLLSASETFTLSIVATAVDFNTPPQIEPLDDVEVAVDRMINIQITATDVDNDELNFSLAQSSPAFLSIDPVDAIISGLPAVVGQYTVGVYANDGKSLASMSFGLDVVEHTNQAPIAADIRNRRVSGSFSYDVSGFFEDPDGDPLTFEAGALPPGLRFSAAGLLSGVESKANRGDHIISVTATDPAGASATDRFKLTIQ